MRIKVDVVNGKLRRLLQLLVAHHARQTVRRLRELLPRVSVTLSQVGQAADGLDKRCVVEMRAGQAAPVVMASTSRSWQDAIKLALRQASERLTAVARPVASITKGQKRLPAVRRPLLR